MAYSMMSSTNYKRKFEFLLPKKEDDDDCGSFDENSIDDWISLDIEDFLAIDDDYDDENENDEGNSFVISSSRFSDAASGFPLHGNNRENLVSKKRKTMESFVDQDLEDTASSPAQSPKVNDFNLFYMKSKEMEDGVITKENGITSQQGGESANNDMSLLESELKRKGLCLIPTSMLLNYLSANI